jgi:AmmeMemoRadiSam system radical SAM enzyme/AmmeMemoRadiSam system protein B/AmmeMemoRadiSam system protein A
MLDQAVAPARWWYTHEDKVVCELCPRKCHIAEGKRGFCFVRANQGGELVLTTYGRSSGFCIDPIEKKPLNHFMPGTPILSLGTAGCNLGCKFCQNWDISKSRETDTLAAMATPEAIVAAAKQNGCRSVAFTYNDPIIWAEYAIDIAKVARAEGIKTVAVTAGYITPEARAEFFSWMDAANVDLKAFTETFYRKLTQTHLQPVLDTLEYLKHETDVWFEITTLIIPGQNDSPDEIGQLCNWVVEHLGDEVPLHFSAFHPDFKMIDTPATPHETLLRARQQAVDAGIKFAYVGNVHDQRNGSTYCPGCGQVLIERDWYELGAYRLDGNRCDQCKTVIPGRFEQGHGDWGRKRQPIRISPIHVPTVPKEHAPKQRAPLDNAHVKTMIDFNYKQTGQILDYTRAVVDATVLGETVDATLPRVLCDAPAYGVFVTLNRRSSMRACLGQWAGSSQAEPQATTLGKLLREVAANAATRDQRFARISARELHLLAVDVSIMHSPADLDARGEDRIAAIKVGADGLVIAHPQGRGLLLPHVATENNWDARTFLEQLALKAGLSNDAWRDDSARLMTFQTRLIRQRAPEKELNPDELTLDRLFDLVEQVNRDVVADVDDSADFDLDEVLLRVHDEELGLYVISESGLNATAIGAGHSLAKLAELAGKSYRQMLTSQNRTTEPVTRLAVLRQPIRLNALDHPDRHRLLWQGAVLAQSKDDWSLALPHPDDRTNKVSQALGGARVDADQWQQGQSEGNPMPRVTAFSMLGFNARDYDADTTVRPAARAGQFYPATADEISRELAAHQACVEQTTPGVHRAVMLPHAGWRFCGDTIAKTLAHVNVPSSAIILGPNHTGQGPAWSVAPHQHWDMPGGAIPIATELVGRLTELAPQLECEPQAHSTEHGSEVLLPFLRHAAPDIRVVPIVLGKIAYDELITLAEALAQVICDDPARAPLLVISSDMNHFASATENRRLDMLAIDAMLSGDPRKLYDICQQNQISMCGLLPAIAVMQALQILGEGKNFNLIDYRNSAAAGGDPTSVVGYAGVVLN